MEITTKKTTQALTASVAIFIVVVASAVLSNEAAVAMTEQRATIHYDARENWFTVNVSEARVSEVLHMMSQKAGFKLIGRLSALDRRVSGTFEGSVQEVVRRLLKDVSYILVSKAGRGRRLTVLESREVSRPSADTSVDAPATKTKTSDSRSRSILELLRKKERELVAMGSRYKEMSAKANATPEVAKRMAGYAERFFQQARAIRTRMNQVR